MLQRWGIMLEVVDANMGGGALCCRGGALCFKWWGHYASSGGCECGRWGIMLQRWGIILQVVDANGSIMPHL